MQAGTKVTRARGGHGDGEHWLDYVYILTVETVRFLKDQIWYRREREKSRIIQAFWLKQLEECSCYLLT